MSINLDEAFEAAEGEYLKFERVENNLSGRPDLHAFLLLEKLLPGGDRDLICASEHDEYWLDVDCEKLAEVATQDDINNLSRCGVRFDRDIESLCLFA